MVKNSASPADLAINRHIARRVGDRREELGMTRNDLDAAIGEPRGTTSKFERGAKLFGADHLVGLARALDVPVGWFFEGLSVVRRVDPRRRPDPGLIAEAGDLIRAYYAIGDRKLRADLLAAIKEMARMLDEREDDEGRSRSSA